MISELHFKSAFQCSSIGSALYSPSSDPVFLDVNDAFLSATSRTREELIGKHLFAEFAEAPGNPEGVQAFRNSLARVIATGKSDTLPAQRYPIKIVSPDGTARFEERIWNGVNIPLFDQQGQLLCILHHAIDITQQIKAEEQVRESAKRLQLATDAAKIGIWMWDFDADQGVWENDQPYAIFGVPHGSAPINLARFMGEFIHPDDREPLQEAIANSSKTGEHFQYIGRFYRQSDRALRWLKLTGLLHLEDKGSRSCIVGTAEDITERKQAEQTLLDNAARQTFLVELGDLLRTSADPEQLQIEVAAKLGKFLDASRVLYGQVENDASDTFIVHRDWRRDGMPSAAGQHRFRDYGCTLVRELQAGRTLVMHDVLDEPAHTAAELETYAALQIRSYVVVPVITKGRIVVYLAVNQTQPRQWQDHEIALIEEVSERAWNAVERIRAETALKLSELRTRALVQASSDVIYTMSPDWGEMRQISGGGFLSDSHQPLTHWWEKYIHPEDREPVLRVVRNAIQSKRVFEMEHRVILADGSLGWTYSRAVPIFNDDEEITEWFGAATDITEKKHTEERIRRASLHDALTGLPNRALLFEYAGHVLPQNLRNNQCAALLYLDLDRFKPINDTHGHDMGDMVLKEIARRLGERLRAEDIVTRLGGDEFAILLQHAKNSALVAEIAGDIIERINKPYDTGELKLSVSTSIGISMFPSDGRDIDTLISHADMAMYQAKRSGRNNFQFYSTEYAAGNKLQNAIEQELKAALSNDTFSLCYQPVIDVQSQAVMSVEALIRLQDSEFGPAQLIPIAETTGVINRIGCWLLREASRQHRVWLDHGLPCVPIAVNVSVVEFRNRDFANRFERTLHEFGIGGDALQLEVTETAVMDDVDHAVALLTQLKKLGVKILLDDFGTGHSSLAYLVRLPLNKVKIDKSFVSLLDRDTASRAVTNAMIALGKTLKLDVVAEGVETEDMLQDVRASGCTQAQGFHLGRPMSGAAFEHWFRSRQGDVPAVLRRALH